MTTPTIAFVAFGVSVIFEVLVYTLRALWRFRVLGSVLILAATAFSASAILLWDPTIWTGLFFTVGMYRVFSTLRIAEARINEVYLRTAVRRSALVLAASQIVVLIGRAFWNRYAPARQDTWLGGSAILLIGSILLLISTARSYYRTKWPLKPKEFSDTDLPSITVAIPARNETEDLQLCLESIVASTYPKLEVLVYDDCSQERHTPEIIRGFAHDGVRFIAGEEPIDSWLAKNTAYDRLYKESSGEFIIFCGVDVRFGPDSLRRLVGFLLDSKKEMVSILPRRDEHVYGRFALIQAMRNWWELAPPRRLFNRPPVVSSCWVISRAALKKAGGFAAVSRSILPEAHFARQLVKSDQYSFRRADEHLGIVSAKLASEQRDTAVRMRYPQLHKRPEIVMLVTMLEGVFLILPFGLLLFGGVLHVSLLAWLCALLTCVFLIAGYMVVAISTHVNRRWFAIVGLPLVALVDIGLLHYSMWRYEFSVVEWKGRNICTPIMHVTPHLPKLPND